MSRKKQDRRWVKAQPRNRPPKWVQEYFREIGFRPDPKAPKDVVVAGLGLVKIEERR